MRERSETRGGTVAKHPLFAPTLQNAQAVGPLREILGAYSGWHFVTRDPIQHFQTRAVECFSELSPPVLSVVGEHDLPDLRTISRRLGAKTAVPGKGHIVEMEAPAQFNALALEFLSSVR